MEESMLNGSDEITTKTKYPVVFLAHETVLIRQLMSELALLEYVEVRDLTREIGIIDPVPHEAIRQALEGAKWLALCTSPASMLPSTRVAQAERYAIELACQLSIPIALCIVNSAHMHPAYVSGTKAVPRIVASFGLQITGLESGWHGAWHMDLFGLPEGVKREHRLFSAEQGWEHFPNNVHRFGCALAETARST
ncbi:hypothetical protein HY970_01710 [Candidatus Kaiserbacteria bacterium]|nr:hypothetical protein [Candidatus Kaiserbacteria bacterium]